MPKILAELSEVWLDRFNAVLPHAIDTLTGFEAQVRASLIDGIPDPETLPEQLLPQIIALRRSLQTIRIMF